MTFSFSLKSQEAYEKKPISRCRRDAYELQNWHCWKQWIRLKYLSSCNALPSPSVKANLRGIRYNLTGKGYRLQTMIQASKVASLIATKKSIRSFRNLIGFFCGKFKAF